MRIRPLPKAWLIHTIEYIPPAEEDDWGNSISEPITINNVRYDQSSVFSRDATQTKIVADGVIFVDATHSSPIPDFIEESKIVFNGRELTLKKVIPCYFPMSAKIRHYELEVI